MVMVIIFFILMLFFFNMRTILAILIICIARHTSMMTHWAIHCFPLAVPWQTAPARDALFIYIMMYPWLL